IRRRKANKHKGAGHRNGFTKGIGNLQSNKEGFNIYGFTLQQLILNSMGLFACLYLGYKHAWYTSLVHENHLWFSNIKEVEREISFRTESGLYYSYYKNMVNAPSIQQGFYELTHDNMTEHPSTINVLERMNVYQELVLAVLYRILPIKSLIEPVYFYINTVFTLHAMLVCALFSTTWMLSGSWLAGILTACFYIFNRVDTTRVSWVIPLRESFALPFLWIQVAAITFYFKPNISVAKEKMSLLLVVICTFIFTLCWQFNQFILLLQAFALFGVWILDIIPPYKVRKLLLTEAASLLVVCAMQFGNKMILGSLVISFIPATIVLMSFRGDKLEACSIPARIFKVFLYSVTGLGLMILFNIALKAIFKVEADEHIYKFLLAKFGIGHPRDFDSRLYLCMDTFGFLQFDTFERLTKGLVFPFYVLTHTLLLVVLFVAVMQNWSNHSQEDSFKDHPSASKRTHLLTSRPELAFHAIQAVFFGALGMSTLRMKFLWTPYMCILAGLGVSDYKAWRTILSQLKTQGMMVQIVRHFATLLTLAALLAICLPPVFKELEDLKEFWDPDTVQLMEWIKKETPSGAALTGSMQLLAGVKLCTGRPITNHPHYEDKLLRDRTKDLYQMYGKRTPEDVYQIMKRYKADFIILEDSICLAPSRGGCRLPDLIDVDNGVIPDNGKKEPGLVHSNVPRFCDEIRRGSAEFLKYFKLVFSNKTFRVHQVV
ncbi:hypothetical protein ScPMuIL_012051, partial [Solemya velum]